MKKPMKALLWSGLAFPGAGHFYLKRYQRGLFFFVPALICVFLYVREQVNAATEVMEKFGNDMMQMDLVALADALDKIPESKTITISFWLFVAIWLAGMVDAYLQGGADRKERARRSQTASIVKH